MTTHTITLARHTAQVVGLMGVLVLGTWDSYGTEQLLLRHGPEWEGLAIDATFHNTSNDEGVTVLADTDGLVPVPPEACMRASKYATITIRGVKDGVQRISCNLPYMVLDHAQVPGANSTATPSENAQALAQMQDLRDGAVDAKRHAEAAQTTASNSADAAANSATAAQESETNASQSATAAANSAADAKNTLESIPDDYSTLSGKVDDNTSGIRDLKEDKLDKPNNPVVGQFLRVKSISDTGEIVLETMAGGGGGGLPNGGTVGQVLAKKSNADGDTEWANIKSEKVTADNITQALGYTPRKAWYVNVTLGNPITADKTAAEIWQAYQDGYSVFAKIVVDGLYPYTLPLVLPMGAETFGFAAVGQLSEDSVPMTVCLAYNTGEWRFFTSEIAPSSAIPTALKNPNALTIKIGSSTTVTYDGSSAKTVEIADGTEVSY